VNSFSPDISHASKLISYANRGARFITTYDQSFEQSPSTLSTEQLRMFLRKAPVITNTANRIVQLSSPCYCQNIFTPTHQPQSCPMWRSRKRNPLVSTWSAIQPLSTCFPTRPWIQSTKPKPAFSTKRSTKLEWGDTRSITNKFRLCDTFELPSVVSLQRSGFWLGCVRCFSNACVQFHSEHFSSCCLVIVEQWYVLLLLTRCMITLTYMQGTRWQHRLLCTGRIPRQPPTSFPCHGYWFFRWRVCLGMLERYLGTKVCITYPSLILCHDLRWSLEICI